MKMNLRHKLIRIVFSGLAGLAVLLSFIRCQSEATPIPIPEVLAEIEFTTDGPEDMVVHYQTGYIYVTNSVNRVGILHETDEIATIETGRRPEALAVNQETGYVYVANRYSDTTTIIRNTEIITTINVAGQEPSDVAIDTKSGWLTW